MKLVKLTVVAVLSMFILTACDQRQADDVSYNLSLQADNFKDMRQITVINCIQGDVLFQMTGRLSIEVDSADNQLEIVVKVDEDSYKKHFIGLSDNVTYVVEDITGDDVSSYSYTLNFNPKMWVPVTIEEIN